MAFARLMCIAWKVHSAKNDLKVEKETAVKASGGDKVKLGLKQKWKHFWIDVSYNTKKRFSNICSCCRGTKLHKCCYRLRHDGTCENFTLKSIAGFIGGFLLTYVFFMFFVFQLNFKLSTATMMCALFGSILTIGLAFSHTVRCIVFLLLPQFFSKRGRQALLAYAFILAITGPAKNTLNNMSILSESLACGQEQLKAAVKQIIEVIKKPFYAVRDAIKTVVHTVKEIVKKIKEILLTIKRIVMAIVRVIKAALQFLAKIINFCNKELGTPFERCSRVFENAISDCNAKLGPMFNWLCSVVYLVQSVCYIVKIFDFVCIIVDFISNSVVGVVIRKIKTFVRHIRTMFYVRIRFSHSFHFETKQSKTMSEVAQGIITEIRHRSESVLTLFDLMSCATSLFFLFMILKTMQYRYRFLTSERFDNIFITQNFRNIDMRRAKLEKETVLPLNNRERKRYVSTGSLFLAKPERKGLSKSAVVLLIATIKLCTHMLIDYALYWVLTVIRYHARYQSKVKAPNMPGVHIQGNGLLADLLKSVVKAFQPMGIELEIDTVPCLPDPIPPDYDRYIQIVSLLILCWILTVLEPYGLRLRQTVMCYYHPTRAKQRAVWLYNHILRSRSSFLKFARRQLRRKVMGSKDITKVTCKEYLRANIRSPLFRLCLGSDKQDTCLLCGEVFREGDKAKPIRCQTPGCPGIYCEECFADLQNLCTVCLDPIEYGDLSDISEERDSSEAEDINKQRALQRRKRKRFNRFFKCCGRHSKDDSNETILPKSSEKIIGDDSDYSSGEKTDYSYSYQEEKDLSVKPETSPKSSFVDAEAQHIPDYVSMGSYHNVIDITGGEVSSSEDEIDQSFKIKTKSKPPPPIPRKRRARRAFSDAYSFLGDFLKTHVMYKVSSDDSEEEESLLFHEKQFFEDTFSTPRSDEFVHFNYSDSYTSSDITRPSYRSNIVPPLHLSPLDSSSSISATQRSLFGNIQYEVVREISSSTPTSRKSQSSLRTTVSRSSSSSCRMYDSSSRNLRYIRHAGARCRDKFNTHRKEVRKYYKSTNRAGSTRHRPVREMKKMSSSLIKFVTRLFHKKPRVLPAAYNDKSSLTDIDQVSLLSRKSSANISCELNSKSSSSSLDLPSGVRTFSSTSPSTFMGSSSAKHLRGGAESGTFENNKQENQASREPPPDLDSTDSDITLLEEAGVIKPHVQFSENESGNLVTLPSSSNKHQMNADDASISPSTKIYSREPPERDESQPAMRDYSNQAIPRYQSSHNAQSKSDSSVFLRHRNKPENYFNTSLIDATTSSTHKECDDSTCSNLKEATALQKYQPMPYEYAVDDEEMCSESTCPYRGQDSSPCLERTHHIKHYRSRRCEKKAGNSSCPCQRCKCYHCQRCTYTTDEDQTTSYSNTSLATDFMDLPYQHNNEYLGLVHELEDTLSARNKERVRKTMREFEYLSRHNKSLEKPIFDYEDEEVSSPETVCQSRKKRHQSKSRRRPRSASVGKNRNCCCEKNDCICGYSRRALTECDRRLAAVPANVGYTGHVMVPKPHVGDMKSKMTARCRTRWNMDPRTGEWYKVYDVLEQRPYHSGHQPRISKPRTPEYCRDREACHSRSRRCSRPECYYCRHTSKYQ